jgi:hypothetical protein
VALLQRIQPASYRLDVIPTITNMSLKLIISDLVFISVVSVVSVVIGVVSPSWGHGVDRNRITDPHILALDRRNLELRIELVASTGVEMGYNVCTYLMLRLASKVLKAAVDNRRGQHYIDRQAVFAALIHRHVLCPPQSQETLDVLSKYEKTRKTFRLMLQ